MSTFFTKTFKELEKVLILRSLEAHQGNRAAVIKELGIARNSLYMKLRDWDIPTNGKGELANMAILKAVKKLLVKYEGI